MGARALQKIEDHFSRGQTFLGVPTRTEHQSIWLDAFALEVSTQTNAEEEAAGVKPMAEIARECRDRESRETEGQAS